MKIDGTTLLIALLVVALAGFGVWQYQRVHALPSAPPPQDGVRVPLIF